MLITAGTLESVDRSILVVYTVLYPDSESIQNVKQTVFEINARVYFVSKIY